MKKSIAVPLFKLLCALPFLAAVMLTSSCQKDNFGYEKTVHFTAAGGELTVDGDKSVYTLEITDYDGNGVVGEEENNDDESVGQYESKIVAQYEWLTAWISMGTEQKKIFLKAEANTSGKRRTLYVRGMVQNTFADIKVIQDK